MRDFLYKMDGKDKYPKFRSLLAMLESRMTVEGVSLSVAEDLKEVRERLQETKKSLFQNEIIFDVLQEILLEFHDKKNKKSVSADELQAYEMLQESMRNAYAKSYLKISHSEDDAKFSNLFGLTEEKLVHKESKKRKVQQILQQYFVPEIEQRLKERCIKLMKLWDSKTEGESDGLSLAKAAKLPVLVENEMKKVVDKRCKLKLEDRNYRKLLLDYQKVMKGYVETLEDFIRKYPLDSHIDKTKTTADWLEAKCQALQLKIRVLHSQLLKDTYDGDTVVALRKIRDLLDTAMAESKSELAKLEKSLKVYESVGSGFESLIKEYARLTTEIDNRKWALTELERTKKMEQHTGN